jgi:hypothetical protein
MRSVKSIIFCFLIFLWMSCENLCAQKSSANVAEIDFEKYTAGQEFTIKDWNNGHDVSVKWTNGFEKGRAIIDDSFSHSGKHSLRILYPALGVGPDESGAQAPLLIPPAAQYYVSYYIRFSENFSWGGTNLFGGKLPGLASGKICSGCQICDGTNGFTARLMWGRNGRLVLYLYHMDKRNVCGDSYNLPDANKVPFAAKKGNWINIVERVKINTESNYDGEVQLWINGVERINKTGIKFVTNGDKIDTFYFSTFFGGSEPGYAPGRDCFIWFDDIVISTSNPMTAIK